MTASTTILRIASLSALRQEATGTPARRRHETGLGGYRDHMEFESIAGHDPGAAVADVVQEAIDATATRYTRLPDIDVEQTLADELRSRGVRATDDGALGEAAQAIRSGHRVDLGVHDDSVE